MKKMVSFVGTGNHEHSKYHNIKHKYRGNINNV